MLFTKKSSLKGEIHIPGDKSISHRAIMVGALAEGTTEIKGFLKGADCLSTIQCFKQMGVEILEDKDIVYVKGNGLAGLKEPDSVLDVGNSGTTARLMSGILAAQEFEAEVTGDSSIKKRPMKRIMEPLTHMGAKIVSRYGNNCAPIRITGCPLKGIHYTSPVASAQIKSSILLAGLYGEGNTSVTEPYVSRNHTEIMFSFFGIPIESKGNTATVSPVAGRDSKGKLHVHHTITARKLTIPGDISSAAYFIAAGLLVPNSEVLIKNVGINLSRDGIIKICKQMGASIELLNVSDSNGEPTADILVKTSNLQGITIGGEIIPTLIDELPVIAVLAACAKGTTIIKDAAELKVKESNRIDVMVENLSKMGADITATEDGMVIHGGKPLHGAAIDSKADHRIAMSFSVAGLVAECSTEIIGAECVDISYPHFYSDIKSLYF